MQYIYKNICISDAYNMFISVTGVSETLKGGCYCITLQYVCFVGQTHYLK